MPTEPSVSFPAGSDHIAVVKVGGSLFDLPSLRDRLSAMIASRPQQKWLFLAGGGPVADVVRDWQPVHDLDDEAAHQLALRSMMLGEVLLVQLLGNARLASSREDATRTWADAAVPVLVAADYMEANESTATIPLAHDWGATSDSIAAWVAATWPADELVLAKSVDAHGEASVEGLAKNGLVDQSLPALANRIPRLSWVNLRGPCELLQVH